jgi:hypothetical protein
MSLHQNIKLLLLHDKHCFVSQWPSSSEIGMLLITNFLELGVVAAMRPKTGKSPTCRLKPSPCRDPAMALRSRFQKGMFMAWQGNGIICVNQTRSLCVNQMGKTQFKALAERHGRGTAGEPHGNGMVCVNPP